MPRASLKKAIGANIFHRLKITLAQTQLAQVRFDDVAMRNAMPKRNRRPQRIHSRREAIETQLDERQTRVRGIKLGI